MMSCALARSGADTPRTSKSGSPSNSAPIPPANSPTVFVMFNSPRIFFSVRSVSSVVKSFPYSVKFRLALRSRLPPRVYPHPLLRMLANNLLNHLRKFLRVHKDVALGISRSNQLHGRLKPQPIFADGVIPIRVSRHNRGIRMQRNARNPRCRARGLAEEIHEHTLFRHGVLVRQNPPRSRLFQCFQQHPRGLILENWPIPRQTS